MRKALDKLIAMYQTPVGQDIIETSIGGGAAAIGQALMTDMTPEEIAIATLVGMGTAMVARPVGGRIAQVGGNAIDRNFPQMSRAFGDGMEQFLEPYPEAMQKMMRAKAAPYSKDGSLTLGGYVSGMGRNYADNLAQLGVAVAAPGLLGPEEEEVIVA